MEKITKEKKVVYSKEFVEDVKKIKTKDLYRKLSSAIEKVIKRPVLGKPLRYKLKNFRTIKVKPFRLMYEYKNEKILFLKFKHRKNVYKTR